MKTFVELSEEEYSQLKPIEKAQYKKAYNKHYGIVKPVPDEVDDSGFVSKKQLREAIRDKCLDCTCDQRAEITQCPIVKCPLWQHRPYQKMKIVEISDDALEDTLDNAA